MAVGAFIVPVWVFYDCLVKSMLILLYYGCPQCAFLPAAVVVFLLFSAMAGAEWRTACSAACVMETSKVRFDF